MATCAECGDGVETAYACRDCGDDFCVDHRLPDDHECASATETAVDATDGGTVKSSPSFSLPTGPRITAFLPVWQKIPWPVHALLAIVLVPVSPLVLGYHVYHERVAHALAAERAESHEDESDAWLPSRVYYFPILLLVVARLIGNLGIVIAMGGIPGMIATIVYVVQKWRHS